MIKYINAVIWMDVSSDTCVRNRFDHNDSEKCVVVDGHSDFVGDDVACKRMVAIHKLSAH